MTGAASALSVDDQGQDDNGTSWRGTTGGRLDLQGKDRCAYPNFPQTP